MIKNMLQEMKHILFGFSTIILINIMIHYFYPFFGCLEMSLTNVFRGNLWCVAFTNINYHIQKYQINFYLAFAGYLLQNANKLVHSVFKD